MMSCTQLEYSSDPCSVFFHCPGWTGALQLPHLLCHLPGHDGLHLLYRSWDEEQNLYGNQQDHGQEEQGGDPGRERRTWGFPHCPRRAGGEERNLQQWTVTQPSVWPGPDVFQDLFSRRTNISIYRFTPIFIRTFCKLPTAGVSS